MAREVGTEGKLGGQAEVKGVAGVWKDLTDSVNSMAGNLTAQVRNIAEVTTAVAKGDLSRKITVDVRGEILELKNTINTMVDQLNSFASEVTRVAQGSRYRRQARRSGGGTGCRGYLEGSDGLGQLHGRQPDQSGPQHRGSDNRRRQGRSLHEDHGDARGEILELKNTINTMVDQLNAFACEVTRVAREVGTEGKLGGQADVRGVAGTWKDLTETVNSMASNLTSRFETSRK